MTKPAIISEEPMNMVQLKAELEKIQKRDTELNFRAARTLEYLGSFVTLSEKDAKELYGKIAALEVPRLKDVHIHKIIDLMPGTVEELKVLLQGYTITVKAENIKKIVDLVGEYGTKKRKE